MGECQGTLCVWVQQGVLRPSCMKKDFDGCRREIIFVLISMKEERAASIFKKRYFLYLESKQVKLERKVSES